jgi:hypothetical protein
MCKILSNVTARTAKAFVPSTSHTFDSLGEETRSYYIHPPAHFGFSSHYPPEISKYLFTDRQMLTRGASVSMNVSLKYCREVVGGIAESTGHSSSIVYGARDNSEYQHLWRDDDPRGAGENKH